MLGWPNGMKIWANTPSFDRMGTRFGPMDLYSQVPFCALFDIRSNGHMIQQNELFLSQSYFLHKLISRAFFRGFTPLCFQAINNPFFLCKTLMPTLRALMPHLRTSFITFFLPFMPQFRFNAFNLLLSFTFQILSFFMHLVSSIVCCIQAFFSFKNIGLCKFSFLYAFMSFIAFTDFIALVIALIEQLFV